MEQYPQTQVDAKWMTLTSKLEKKTTTLLLPTKRQFKDESMETQFMDFWDQRHYFEMQASMCFVFSIFLGLLMADHAFVQSLDQAIVTCFLICFISAFIFLSFSHFNPLVQRMEKRFHIRLAHFSNLPFFAFLCFLSYQHTISSNSDKFETNSFIIFFLISMIAIHTIGKWNARDFKRAVIGSILFWNILAILKLLGIKFGGDDNTTDVCNEEDDFTVTRLILTDFIFFFAAVTCN